MHNATVRRGKKIFRVSLWLLSCLFLCVSCSSWPFFSRQKKKSTIHPPHFLFLSGLNAVEACTLTVQPEKNFIHSLWYCAINVTSSLDTYLKCSLWEFFFLNILTQCVANSDRKLTDEAATSKHLAMMEKQQQLQSKVCLFVWGSWVQRQV